MDIYQAVFIFWISITITGIVELKI